MITNQPECLECGGACCDSSRLEFPVPRTVTARDAPGVLRGMGLGNAEPIEVRVNSHGRKVIRTHCYRRGSCETETRPIACLMFPENYLDPDQRTDAERAEIRPFCALFRRLEATQ